MPLILHFHPLSSFCHKVLIALYENGTSFDPQIVAFGDPESGARLHALWPLDRIPVLVDCGNVIPETSIMIEHLQIHHPGPVRLLPNDPELCLEARLWDRFFDLYVNVPMQKIVAQRFKPEGHRDPAGAEEARATLTTAYGMIERQLAGKQWAVGSIFTIADCAAASALFYASIVHPFAESQNNLAAYFERLLARASMQRVLEEAKPFFQYFPYREAMPARFLDA